MKTDLSVSTKILLTAFSRGLEVFLWVTVGAGLSYLCWLAPSGNPLLPVPTHGPVIQLDLLQTLAFLIALPALEGTIVVNGD